MIVDTDSTIFFLEAKLTSTNDTQPSEPSRGARYTAGADGWFGKVVDTDFETVAQKEKRYELLRLWLLGTWIAAKREKAFCLVNLVRTLSERTAIDSMSSHLIASPERRLKRATWEGIHDLVASSTPHSANDNRLLHYMREKTVGYSSGGALKAAFAL